MSAVGRWTQVGFAAAFTLRLIASLMIVLAVERHAVILTGVFVLLALLAVVGGLAGHNSFTGLAAGVSILIVVLMVDDAEPRYWLLLLTCCLSFTELYLWDFARSARRNSFVDRRVALGSALVIGEVWLLTALVAGLLAQVDSQNSTRFAQAAGIAAVAILVGAVLWLVRRRATDRNPSAVLRVGAVLDSAPDRRSSL